MSGLYETDVLEWSEHQGRLLRQHVAGAQGNEAPDWANIIEEVESVGREQLHAVEGLLTQALIHMLKAEAWPLLADAPNWRADARTFRRQARRRYTASMRQKLDLAGLYDDALAGLPETMDGQPPLPVPPTCPVSLDELLSQA